MSETAIEALLQHELSRHPLGQEVMALVAETGAGPGDLGVLARVVSGLNGAGGSDARAILVLSAMLDRIAGFEARRATGTAPFQDCDG